MTIKLTGNKKIILAIISFVILIALVSFVYILLNPKTSQVNNNPGGTGGDYTPANTVDITNAGILYTYVGSAGTDQIISILNDTVLYNVSLSNDPSADPSDYVQVNNFKTDFDTTVRKLYKKDASYVATIDDGIVNSTNNIPWNYWFTFTTNDGRKYRSDINVNPDNENNLISIKKTN